MPHKDRRLCRDMIEVFKIMHNIYTKQKYHPVLVLGIIQKLTPEVINTNYLTTLCTMILRKHSFCAHIVNIWNSLPKSVVDVDTVCLSKAHLDKFWMHQDVRYDFTANLTIIGDRSVYEISIL